jgi:hypothetical protein
MLFFVAIGFCITAAVIIEQWQKGKLPRNAWLAYPIFPGEVSFVPQASAGRLRTDLLINIY